MVHWSKAPSEHVTPRLSTSRVKPICNNRSVPLMYDVYDFESGYSAKDDILAFVFFLAMVIFGWCPRPPAAFCPSSWSFPVCLGGLRRPFFIKMVISGRSPRPPAVFYIPPRIAVLLMPPSRSGF